MSPADDQSVFARTWLAEWVEHKETFAWDGGLLDLIVQHTGIEDWQAFIRFLLTDVYVVRYTVEGQPKPLPHSAVSIFALAREDHVNLCIDPEHLALNCHFFDVEEIELDLDPRDIANELRLAQLLQCMRAIGTAIDREVALTPESAHHILLCRYNPREETFTWSC